MGAMKRFAEAVSVRMGLGGEITDEVLTEAQRELDADVATLAESQDGPSGVAVAESQEGK